MQGVGLDREECSRRWGDPQRWWDSHTQKDTLSELKWQSLDEDLGAMPPIGVALAISETEKGRLRSLELTGEETKVGIDSWLRKWSWIEEKMKLLGEFLENFGRLTGEKRSREAHYKSQPEA